jgi:hypothetical protein
MIALCVVLALANVPLMQFLRVTANTLLMQTHVLIVVHVQVLAP